MNAWHVLIVRTSGTVPTCVCESLNNRSEKPWVIFNAISILQFKQPIFKPQKSTFFYFIFFSIVKIIEFC